MREEIKNCIFKRISALRDGYRHNIGLLGPEGCGKTTLLHAIYEGILGYQDLIPIYIYAPSIDLTNLFEKWTRNIIRGVLLSHSLPLPEDQSALLTSAEAIIPKTMSHIKNLKKILHKDRCANPRDFFALTAILSEETGKKNVLMIDEVHELPSLINGDVFGSLGKEIMVQKQTLFLLTTSDVRSENEIFHEKLSLLFNNFEILRLENFDTKEAADFFNSHLGSQHVCDTVKRYLVEVTGGSPVYMTDLWNGIQSQNLLRPQGGLEWFHGDKKAVSEKRLYDVFFDEFVLSGRLNYFFQKKLAHIIGAFKEKNLVLKVLIGIAEGYHKPYEVAAYCEKKLIDAKKMLTKLEEEGALRKNGFIYYFNDPLLEFWLREIYAENFYYTIMSEEMRRGYFIKKFMKHFELFEASQKLSRLEHLQVVLKRARNDLVSFPGKKVRIPAFQEWTVLDYRDAETILARSKESRWSFRVFCHRVEEKDITSFLLDMKQQNKRISHRVVIALEGIEQNAKLLAQELKIQIWDRSDMNLLCRIYGCFRFHDQNFEVNHEQVVGSMAESIYSA